MSVYKQATTVSLCARRQELHARLEQLNQDAHRAEGPVPQDFADRASLCENDEVVDRLRATTARDLDRVETALARIAEGRYGRCRACGRQIGARRLEVLPEAAFCLDCARKDLENQMY